MDNYPTLNLDGGLKYKG
jgi:hypothetical protein